jgi:hypothetical protein
LGTHWKQEGNTLGRTKILFLVLFGCLGAKNFHQKEGYITLEIEDLKFEFMTIIKILNIISQ